MPLRRSVPLILALALAACGGGSDPEPTPAPPAEGTPADDPALSSTPPPPPGDGSSPAVNSIAVDPGDGTIMVGSGPALFIVRPGEKEGERLLGRLTTPNGNGTVSGNLVVRFTGPNELLASGHPQEGALSENLPLIRSSDHGATWEAIPGSPEGDYHELEVAGDVLLAVDVLAPDKLKVSRDGGQTWEERTPPAQPIDVVVDPGDPQQWAISTEQGTFISSDGGNSWRPRDVTSGARLVWPAPDALYSLDRNGELRVSPDGGRSWQDRGDVGGLPSELTTGRKDELFVAVVGGKVRRSSDGGRTWSTVATLR